MTATVVQREIGVHQPRLAPSEFSWRMRNAAVCLLLTALAFNSDSGRIAPDTKIDLVTSPGAFLARALRLWDSQGFAGQLQNQAYGYLFPMGPFFWLGHVAGIPPWIVQRLWWSLLLCGSFLGVVILARALHIGNPLTRLLAGVAYACSPHVLSLLGANSVEALPMCVAPWVVIPLVIGSKSGSTRRAGLACGVAILCMGGVNAAADLAAVLPAVLWLVTRRPGPRLRSLAGWSALGAVLATTWWLVPLFLLGRYSPQFLDYIENAGATTSTTSLIEVLRGTSDWVAYLPTSGWRAGSMLLTQPALIVNSIVVACVGLAGVAWRRTPHRLWLVACLATGVVAMTFGHSAGVGSVFAGGERSLLDNALAPLRNVHKFDVLIRLPLVLGLAHLTSRVRWGRLAIEQRTTRVTAAAIVGIAVVGTAAPLAALQLAPAGTYNAIPAYWQQAATWLRDQDSVGRSLVVPASSFADYYWGRPTDEPMQPLAGSEWEVRNGIPLVPAGHIRMLDTIEQQLAAGTSSSALAAYLARNGISYLVVRNDLDYAFAQALQPAVVHATLSRSPGLTRVATFGPEVGSAGTLALAMDQGLQQSYPAVEIWAVAAAPTEQRVSAAAASSVIQVSGGPESLLPLQQEGVLTQTPTVLTGDSTPSINSGTVVLTDGMRRREVNFGAPPGHASTTMTATQKGRLANGQSDYLPFPGLEHQSVVEYIGAKSIEASSSAADADALRATVPADQPYSAFDADPSTVWISAVGTAAIGQWLQIDFDTPRVLSTASVELPVDDGHITSLTVTTQAGSSQTVLERGDVHALRVPSGSTEFLRVTVSGVQAGSSFAQVGVAELTIPGVRVARTIVAPEDLPTAKPVDEIAFSTPADARNGCLLLDDRPLCASGLARLSEDAAALDRTFALPVGSVYTSAAVATPRAGAGLESFIASRAKYPVVATASSQAVPDPLAGAQTAIDDDLSSGWIADAADSDPTLTLKWAKPRKLTSLSITTQVELAATRPDVVRITSAEGNRTAAIGPDGTAHFAALSTNEVSLHFASGLGLRGSWNPTTRSVTPFGIGISELRLPGIPTLGRASAEQEPVALPCGKGPSVTIDGHAMRTAVRTTVGALRDLQAVRLSICHEGGVDLATGQHRLVMRSTAIWRASSIVLTRAGAPPAAGAVELSATPSVQVARWGATSRSVIVGARSAAAVLVVNENVNPGWQARANGHQLPKVTIDGWRQGYLLPAGAQTAVTLTFTPQRGYLAGLSVGLFAVLALLAGALARSRRRKAAPAPARAWRGSIMFPLLAAGTAVLVGGAIGLIVFAGVTVCLAYTSSLLRTPWWRRALAPALAACALAVSGLLLVGGHWQARHYVANSNLLQVLCLVALMSAIIGRSTTWLPEWIGAPPRAVVEAESPDQAEMLEPTVAAASPGAPRTDR